MDVLAALPVCFFGWWIAYKIPVSYTHLYRKLVLTKTYVAVYKMIGDTVYIYAIVNGATDYPRLLK